MGWDGLVWVEMDGDGRGWVGMGVWDQLDGCLDGCWERQLWPRNCFVYLPAPFLKHFESLRMGLGSSWVQIGVRLGTMFPNGRTSGALRNSWITFGGALLSIWATLTFKI